MRRSAPFVAAAAFLLAAAGGCAVPDAGPPGPRVVLVTLDTTRADHLTPYGYARDTSPRLRGIAEGGVIFTRAYCGMPTTDPSHATFLTGTYPRRHGVTRNGQRAAPGLPSLPARLKARGMRTAAFISRKHLDPRELGVEGFDLVDAPQDRERRAETTAGRALRWLRRRRDGAYFLWVHLFDPHSPYAPPAPFDRRHGEGPPEARLGKMGWLEAAVRHEPAVAANNVRLYDGEISYADEWLGRVVEAAEALPGEPPLVVVAGDHGESLDDLEPRFRYAFAHGEFLYDHQTRVPLVMRWKGRLPEGREVRALVEGVDLAPTILELLGEAQPLGGDGVARAALTAGRTEEGAEEAFIQRRSFAVPEQPFLAAPEFAVVAGWTKLIVNGLKPDELYDLRADPEERDNLADRLPDVVREMKGRLGRWLEAHPATDPEAEATEEELKDLKALGYVE